MTTTEFPINLFEDHEGLGTLIVTDAALLVRPRRIPNLYPASVNHDTQYAGSLLDYASDMGQYQWHIICQGDPSAAHRLLDRVFYAYVDSCCFELWCDACVRYIVDGKTIRTKGYGFSDGQYTMYFNVYCGIAGDQTEEFLATLTGQQTDRFIVVRPDSSELGYNVHGFEVESDEDDSDDEPEEDEGDFVSTGEVFGRAYAHFGNHEMAREAAEMYPGDFM